MPIVNPKSCPKHSSVCIFHALVRRCRIMATLLIRLYARRVVKRACDRALQITLPLRSRIIAFNTLDASLSERRFKRTFRISRATFQKLCETVSSHREEAGCGWSRFTIETRVSMTLRYFAGGSCIDVAMAYSVSVSTLYYIIEATVSDINNCSKLQFPWNDCGRLERISEGFTRGRSPLHGCVGALDGIAIKIVDPSSSDVDNPVTYYNRKWSFWIVRTSCT
jgi:hypothetical protein